MSKSVVLSMSEWNPSEVRYMQPKIGAAGKGKSINVISTQSNRSLHVSTPLLMCWGISDFVDENGESDGKFSMSLQFPNESYHTDQTRHCLEQFKSFEDQIIEDAVNNSQVWFGEKRSAEIVRHTFFPFLKYAKTNGEVDYTKGPSLKSRVPRYNEKWNVELYDVKQELLFPSEDENLTPMDFVPKKSHVACVLQCGGIWTGGKGWGVTWKLTQAVVKPTEVVGVFGKCHITLTETDLNVSNNMNSDNDDSDEDTTGLKPPVLSREKTTEKVPTQEPDTESEEDEPEPEPEPVVKKKVVRKKTVAK